MFVSGVAAMWLMIGHRSDSAAAQAAGTTTTSVSAPPISVLPPQTGALASALRPEIADNHLGTPVFSGPEGDAPTGSGPDRIPYGTTVKVECWAPANHSGITSIKAFYLVQTKPWIGLWAPANTFANGDPLGKAGTTVIDPAVPECAGGQLVGW
jgi:hypothetical protein